MTQADIMEYLDKHPNIYFDAKDINTVIKEMNLVTTHKALRKIIKRREYGLKLVIVKGKFRSLYTRV